MRLEWTSKQPNDLLAESSPITVVSIRSNVFIKKLYEFVLIAAF